MYVAEFWHNDSEENRMAFNLKAVIIKGGCASIPVMS